MNLSAIKTVAVRGGTKALLTTRRYSPEILVGVGIVSLLGAGVLAARSTLKLNETVDRIADRTDKAKEAVAEGAPTKMIAKAYGHNTLDMVKLYGPSVSLAVVGVVAICGSYGILRNRNLALVGAYKALETSYNAYRERVREEVGEEKEQNLYLGLKEVSEKNPETGKVEKFKTAGDPTKISPYARFFDRDNKNYDHASADANFAFLRTVQEYATLKLQSQGYLLLNDVYDRLGFERTSIGAVNGWVLDEHSDGYVDFGMYNTRNSAFINGDEKVLLVDFNVDGFILDQIDQITVLNRTPRVKRRDS